jgi:hypothetical protein
VCTEQQYTKTDVTNYTSLKRQSMMTAKTVVLMLVASNLAIRLISRGEGAARERN